MKQRKVIVWALLMILSVMGLWGLLVHAQKDCDPWVLTNVSYSCRPIRCGHYTGSAYNRYYFIKRCTWKGEPYAIHRSTDEFLGCCGSYDPPNPGPSPTVNIRTGVEDFIKKGLDALASPKAHGWS